MSIATSNVRSSLWKGIFSALILGSALSCGSSDGEANQGSQPPAGTADACQQFAVARCAKEAECSPLDLQLGHSTVQNCETFYAAECVLSLTGSGVLATPADVQTCTDAIKAWSCKPDQRLQALAACVLPAGSLGANAKCVNNYQCQSRYCSGGYPGCGSCSDPAQGAEGAKCDVVSGPGCATGLYCSLSAGTCKKQVKHGEACELRACELPDTCVNGACGSYATEGGACSSLMDCGPDLVCNMSTKKCEKVPVAAVGKACGLSGAVPVLCDGHAACDIDGTSKGTCVTVGAEGEPCGHPSNAWVDSCMEGLLCKNGTCARAPVPACQ